MGDEWTFAAVGDVVIDRPNPEAVFDLVTPILKSASITFGNCETAICDRPILPGALPIGSKPFVAGILAKAGFNVMSLANNHAMNAGAQGLFDTRALLSAHGIATAGAGRTAIEARAPVIVKRGGEDVAFLAFTSIFLPQDVATATGPGVAALRSHNEYYFDYFWSSTGVVIPGEDPKVKTTPYPEDLMTLAEAVASAKAAADVVIVSFHAGLSNGPGVLSDYEKVYARAAIDAGADAVVGHHHHFLRGVEFYKGKPIAYGLGIFVLDLPRLFQNPDQIVIARLKSGTGYTMWPREGYPLVPPFDPDCRYSVIANVLFEGPSVKGFYFVPVYINDEGQPEPVDPSSVHGEAVVRYLERASSIAELNIRYVISDRSVTGMRMIQALPIEGRLT